MANNKEKLSKIFSTALELLSKIFRWRSEKLDKNMHVKYDPNSKSAKSQLEAILADINENPQAVQETLKMAYLAENFSSTPGTGFENIELSTKGDTDKEVNHRKKLKEEQETRSHLSKFSFLRNRK